MDPLENQFAARADVGSGDFAVAYALLRVAAALRDLGFGDSQRAGAPNGTGERLAMEVAEVAKALHGVAGAIENRG